MYLCLYLHRFFIPMFEWSIRFNIIFNKRHKTHFSKGKFHLKKDTIPDTFFIGYFSSPTHEIINFVLKYQAAHKWLQMVCRLVNFICSPKFKIDFVPFLTWWDGYIYRLRRQRPSIYVGFRCSHPMSLAENTEQKSEKSLRLPTAVTTQKIEQSASSGFPKVMWMKVSSIHQFEINISLSESV